VPTSAEWDTLQIFLVTNGFNWDGTTDTSTQNKIGKSLAARTDWIVSAVPGTVGNDMASNNRSGFSGLPAGSRYYDVNFNYIGQIGYWWTSSAPDAAHAYYRMLNSVNEFLDSYEMLNTCGLSVRLVKD
jgi:uncharacterized protein (TIGR02145 family)